jgi:plastocyanin
VGSELPVRARVLVLAGAFALTACGGDSSGPPPPPAGAIPAGQAIGSATVSGRALFAGAPPARRPIKMSGEASCHRPEGPALSEDLIVGPDGGVRNVYVHVVSGLGDRVFAPPVEPAVMDQQGCIFIPHVLAAQSNQVVVFTNSDPAAHNVHSVARRNRPFNISMSGKGRAVRRFFTEPEVVKIRCDIHAWMGAFIPVDGHPFQAVTGEDGSFRLTGLPAGEYDVEAWHETLGPARRTVSVAEGESRQVDFTFAR